MTTSTVPHSTESTLNDLDRDLNFFRLHSLETRLDGLPAGHERDYFLGVLANRHGQSAQSTEILEAILPALRSERPDRAVVALMTLSDNYVNLARYADAIRSYRELLTELASHLSPEDADNLGDSLTLAEALLPYPGTVASFQGPVDLPIQISRVGTKDLELDVQGVRIPWVLDTGASYSVITQSLADRINIPRSAKSAFIKGGLNGIKNEVHVGLLPQLSVGGATIANVAVLIFPDDLLRVSWGTPESYQIQSILGFPVFRALGCVGFRHDGRFQAGLRPAPGAGTARMFLNTRKLLIEARVGDSVLPFGFDTGADVSTLSKRYVQEFPEQFATAKKVEAVFGGAGGVSKVEVYHLSDWKLKIGNSEVVLRGINAFPKAIGTDADEVYGNLGRDITAGAQGFTIDFETMTFSLVTS